METQVSAARGKLRALKREVREPAAPCKGGDGQAGMKKIMRGFSSQDSTRSRAAQIVRACGVPVLAARLTAGGPCAQLAECFAEAAHHREECG
jgi:hypothetical protein